MTGFFVSGTLMPISHGWIEIGFVSGTLMPLFMYKEPMGQRCSRHLNDISSVLGGHGMKLALCLEHLCLFGKDEHK